jgi:hypothetical protein
MNRTLLAKNVIVGVLLALGLLAGGCVRTTHPVLTDDQLSPNDALLGKWVSKDGKTSAELKPGDAGKYKLVYTNEDGKSGNFLVRFGKIGEVSVAEIAPDAFTPKSSDEYKSLLMPMYTLVVIQKTDPELVLTGISIDWLKKYVKAHPDELDVNNPDDLVIESPTIDFQGFFTRHYKDDGMLTDPATFVRPPSGK